MGYDWVAKRKVYGSVICIVRISWSFIVEEDKVRLVEESLN